MAGAAQIPSVVDGLEVPDQLTARVVSPGWQPRLHGYGVQDDLACHYSFGELVLTALTGEAPQPTQGRAFEVAAAFAAAIGIGEAPCHAAMLARLCGARPSGALAVAGITLSEQARHVVSEHAALLAWLQSSDSELPSDSAPRGADEAAAVERLRAALRARGVDCPMLEASLGLSASILVVFYTAGLREPWQLESAWCMARWPVAIAEAMAATDLKSYPMRLPAFEYVAGEAAT
jgi:hypothetical protein